MITPVKNKPILLSANKSSRKIIRSPDNIEKYLKNQMKEETIYISFDKEDGNAGDQAQVLEEQLRS